MSIQEQYHSVKQELLNTLSVLDTYVDGIHRPQELGNTTDWIEVINSPGVFVRNITLYKPDIFAIILVHGTKGSYQIEHKVSDELQIHCISGRVLLNNLEFKSGDRIKIPSNTVYSFNFLENTYLTVAFTPINNKNILNGHDILTKNTTASSEIKTGSTINSTRN